MKWRSPFFASLGIFEQYGFRLARQIETHRVLNLLKTLCVPGIFISYWLSPSTHVHPNLIGISVDDAMRPWNSETTHRDIVMRISLRPQLFCVRQDSFHAKPLSSQGKAKVRKIQPRKFRITPHFTIRSYPKDQFPSPAGHNQDPLRNIQKPN